MQKSIQKRRDEEDISLNDDFLKLSITKNGIFKSNEIIEIEKSLKKNFNILNLYPLIRTNFQVSETMRLKLIIKTTLKK